MRMRQYVGRLARPAGIGQGLAISGQHFDIAREFDRQPLQNRDGLRMFGHAAQGPRVIQRDGPYHPGCGRIGVPIPPQCAAYRVRKLPQGDRTRH
jgi:hypothetical protein